MPRTGGAAWEGSDRRARLPANWASVVRPLVFATYGDVCHVCGRSGSDDVDHLVNGDDHSLENLRPIHYDPCHKQKSSLEGNAANAARRARGKYPRERHPGLR